MSKLRALAAMLTTAVALAACGGQHQSATGSVHPPGWGRPLPSGLAAIAPAATPTARMYDTVTLPTIPRKPYATAGYTSGNWPTYPSLRHEFPAAHTISIAIHANLHADCLDVEPGDADPSQVASWVRADRAAGYKRPCVYSSIWEYTHEIRPLLAAAHIARASIYEWDADYTGTDHLDAGFDATQWTSRCLARNLDCSRVTLGFLTVASPPYRAPKPKPRLPVCVHHRLAKATCAADKAEVASLKRAVTSSRKAATAARAGLKAHGCTRPYRRTVCRRLGRLDSVLSNRVRVFTAHALSLEKVL